VWATSFSVGGAIGPLLGGALLQRFWWGSVFLLAVPVMALLLVLGPVLLPEYRDAGARRLDLRSALMSLVAVLAGIYGLKAWAQDGAGWVPAASIAAGLAIGVAFVRRQRRLADPLVDLRLLRVPAFRASLATFTLTTAVVFGSYVFVGQYLQLVLGLSPLRAGLWMLPGSVGVIAGSLLAPTIVRRVSPAWVMGGGLLLATVGFAVLTQVGRLGLPGLVVGTALTYVGLGPVFTLGTDLVVGSAPPQRAGAAAAMSETSSELGGALGIAVLGSVGTAVYRGLMAQAALGDVPAAVREAARSTLGGAAAAASALPGPGGALVLDAARAAFTEALQLTGGVCAAIAAATAILAVTVLRRSGPGAAAREERRPVPERPTPRRGDPTVSALEAVP
jgi:DHA2 family multidrug resistance protein-like MFS transporter